MKNMVFLLALCVSTIHGLAAELPDELVARITDTIREHCPEAKIEMVNEVLTAKGGTMMFTVHRHSKTGEYYPDTSEIEGPNFEGFILRISLKEGGYQGAAAVPQTLEEPYFTTFISAPRTDDGESHYWINFSYGSRLDDKLKHAIFEVVPKTIVAGNP